MDILIKSIVGGFVIALVLIFAKFFGPRVAGFVSAIPASFVVGYILTTIEEKNIISIEKFLTGGFIAGIAFILFIGVLLGANKLGFGYWESLIIAYLFWGVCFGLFIYFK
jgi:uncharacterized membrane protein (GlpM family)